MAVSSSNIWPQELRRTPRDRPVRNTVVKMLTFYRFEERGTGEIPAIPANRLRKWLRQADCTVDIADYFADAKCLQAFMYDVFEQNGLVKTRNQVCKEEDG